MEGKWGNVIGQCKGSEQGGGPPDGPGAPAAQGSIPGAQLEHEPGGLWGGGPARLQGGVQGKKPQGIPEGQPRVKEIPGHGSQKDSFLATKAL